MQNKWCIPCGEDVWVVDGSHLLIDEKNKASLCYGPFAESAPPEIEDGWYGTGWNDNLVEPEPEFMLISDMWADSLRLQFEGEE